MRTASFIYKYRFWLTLAAIFLLWLGLRFYHLDQTEFFYNDSGRDYLTVYKLIYQHHLPLLGPSTASAALNQSAFFFYWLTPILWLTNFPFWGSQAALLIYTWIFILLSARLVSRQPRYWPTFWLMLLFYAFSPLSLSVERVHIWNPHFTWPALFLAFWLYVSRSQPTKSRLKTPFWSGACLAISNAMSFATFPACFAWAAVYARRLRAWLAYILGFLCTNFVLFSPMLAFELRHGGQITRRAIANWLNGDTVRINSLGGSLSWRDKLVAFANHFSIQPTIFYLFIIILLLVGFINWRTRARWRGFYLALAGIVMTLSLSLLYPVAIHSHYTAALEFFIIAAAASAPQNWRILTSSFVAIYSFFMLLSRNYFINQHRPYSYAELMDCARLVCDQAGTTPLFVALESGYYVNHTAPEFQFALLRAGCQALDIATSDPAAASQMVVFGSSGARYDTTTSSFYELTLFGEASASASGQCSSDLNWTLLER